MMGAGKAMTRMAVSREMSTEQRMPMAMTRRMALVSPLPQYWAMRMAPPSVRPRKMPETMLKGWSAMAEADMGISPRAPSMMLLRVVTLYISADCSARGMARDSTEP